MNNQDRDTFRGDGGGEKGNGGGENKTQPSSGSATANNITTNISGGGGAPSATATTNLATTNNKNKTTNNMNPPTNTGARSSSTESEGNAHREYGERRRLANVPSDDEDDEDDDEDMDDDEEDDEGEGEEAEEEEGDNANDSGGESSSHHSSLSARSRSLPHPQQQQQQQQQSQHQRQSLVHSHTSSSSGSPVRRLPAMLRPPMGTAQQQQLQSKASAHASAAYANSSRGGFDMATAASSSPTLYGLHPRQHQQYYEQAYMSTNSPQHHQVSPRDAPSSASAATAAVMDGSVRVLPQKRRLHQSTSGGEYGAGSPPALSQPQSSTAAPTSTGGGALPSSRAIYENSLHHTSSTSSSSTARSANIGGGNGGSGGKDTSGGSGSGMSSNNHLTPDDDDNDDPLRFETRGSHGPRDEARYETWTSKQLRKKCSHLKLRGLKNVKKHVMVEALYRYYRNQRGKQSTVGATSITNAGGGGSSGSVRGGSGGGSSMASGGHGYNGHGNSNGNNTGNGSSVGGNRAAGERERDRASTEASSSQSSRRYHDTYASQSSHHPRYEHSGNANTSTSSSNFLANAVAASLLRGTHRPTAGGGGNAQQQHQQQHQQQQQQQQQHQSSNSIARRSSPSSMAGSSMRAPQRSVSLNGEGRNGAGAGAGSGSGNYNSVIDLEETKYDALDNEVRITSEDVIRLVDVILSPEFVDRLTSELSRWQFWVDIREKYVSLVSGGSTSSSYGAARGLTALGGDHHQGDRQSASGGARGAGGGSSVDRMSVTSSFVRPSAKWSSMQLWEMWKELTFAYTKTCFEFTAAGVDERNYIQFCEGRPDVYYLHQRLHARPDLLHLIKSNEYIEEKCTSDAASDHNTMNAEKNAANALMGVSTPGGQQRPHKRFKRIVPAGAGGGGSGSTSGSVSVGVADSAPANAASASGNYGTGSGGGGGGGASAATGGGAAAATAGDNSGDASENDGNASGSSGNDCEMPTAPPNATPGVGRVSSNNNNNNNNNNNASNDARQYLANDSPTGQQEEGSTENSETTGEDNSVEKSNSNATSDSTRREALAEQKYFGLLLQNFEAIFESLHNKKVLLAALRKDSGAPDHLIADLHDDIHVLSALKKDFRNKLRQALE